MILILGGTTEGRIAARTLEDHSTTLPKETSRK